LGVKSNLNVCFVFKGDIFDSSASRNRILSLARGLKNAGAEPFIYGFSPFENESHSPRGMCDSINYSYPNIESAWFLVRFLISILGLLYRYPLFILKNKVNVIYLYDIPLFAKWTILFYKVFFKYIIVEENNEYPLILLRKSKIKKFLGKFYIIFAYRFLDGMVVMTKNLLQYFKPLTSRMTKFEIINMTVDINRFNNVPVNNTIYYEYLAYCGSLRQSKDGILTLIQAFSKITITFPEIKLLIIGNGTEVERMAIFKMIQSLMVQGKVILAGFISKDEIPYYLSNAKGLILPRPKSFQAEGAFPTKLGEYLATGKPVIATRVGEIPNFLTDGNNCYLAEPGSVKSLSEKMMELLSDTDRARKIGINGKQLTTLEFSHLVQSKKLYDFLYDIYNKSIT
jgi:glycosyltransferase involved in cell wall biosynthesis